MQEKSLSFRAVGVARNQIQRITTSGVLAAFHYICPLASFSAERSLAAGQENAWLILVTCPQKKQSITTLIKKPYF
jgi:hypothetical protein